MPAFRAIASHERRPIVVRGGRVFQAGRDVRLQDILIEDERIIDLERPGFSIPEDAELISADDRLLIPTRTSIRRTRSIGLPSTTRSRSRCSLRVPARARVALTTNNSLPRSQQPK